MPGIFIAAMFMAAPYVVARTGYRLAFLHVGTLIGKRTDMRKNILSFDKIIQVFQSDKCS